MMTYIGMGALLVGCFMLVVGWQSGVKGKLMGQGAILIVAGACIGIGGNPARDTQLSRRTLQREQSADADSPRHKVWKSHTASQTVY